MTEADARAKGFTREVAAEGGFYSLELLTKPDVDFDTAFKAWDTNEGEWLTIYGWQFIFYTDDE